MEDYAEGPNGKHMVQYFDKTRMEVNNPNSDRNSRWFVTNGLLTRELISGYMQVGDKQEVLRWPAHIVIAGDVNGSGITYASFRGAIARKDANAIGKVVIAWIQASGAIDFEHGAAAYMNFERYNVKNAYFESITMHNIPDVFWNFLNARGPVMENGRAIEGRLSDPYFYATGYPIADAYWTSTILNGQQTDVLIQPYERRLLTYVPTNPEGFKVEMGNVGQHYYEWRYNNAGKPQALAGTCNAATQPKLGFGKVYNENDIVKINLGCSTTNEERYTVAQQAFERGRMFGVTRYDFYTGRNYEDVFVLLNDGTAYTFPYNPTEGVQPPAIPDPPSPGLYKPEGNFAVIWANQRLTDDPMLVRGYLGYATTPRQVQVSVQGSGGGVAQFFRGGLMLYPNLVAEKKIYVLSNISGDAYIVRGPHLTLIDVNRWAVYDDTFQP
jgi:hypothetical protein